MIFFFSADQTPTPTTRLIQNCEEIGLFDDLKHVNPFEETFRQAVDGKCKSSTVLLTQKSLELIKCNDEDTLHTPILCNGDKEKKPLNHSSAEKPLPSLSPQSAKILPPTPTRKEINSPKVIENSGKKPLDRNKQKTFRKIHPKPVIVPVAAHISNPIKEKIRQSLLHNNDKNKATANSFVIAADKPKAEHKWRATRSKDSSTNERNREAARRYRNKQRVLHDKLLAQNEQLEAEVVLLRLQLDAFKRAHEKCSVTQSYGCVGRILG